MNSRSTTGALQRRRTPLVWAARAIAALALALQAPPAALGAWSPARSFAAGAAVRAAWADPGGNIGLVAAGRRTTLRFAWGATAPFPAPLAALPYAPPHDGEPSWRANRRGDVLAVDGADAVRAAMIDADGGVTAFTEASGSRAAGEIADALGDDGTAAVAWTERRLSDDEELPAVFVRLRAPGGGFGPKIALEAPGPVRAVAIDVRADGYIAVAFGAWDGRRHVVMYADGGLDGFAAPQFVGTTEAGAPFFLGVVAGAPGRGRVLTEDDEAGLAFLRTGPATWTPPQRFEARSADLLAGVTVLPDGGTAVAYQAGTRLAVRRASPGNGFGAPGTVGRVPACWFSVFKSFAVDSVGDLLLSWDESVQGGFGCADASFARVNAAFAPAGQAFWPAHTVSPLGTVTDEQAAVAALSDRGRRVVAWTARPPDERAPGDMVVATGTAAPDPRAPTDRRAPVVALPVTTHALRGGQPPADFVHGLGAPSAARSRWRSSLLARATGSDRSARRRSTLARHRSCGG